MKQQEAEVIKELVTTLKAQNVGQFKCGSFEVAFNPPQEAVDPLAQEVNKDLQAELKRFQAKEREDQLRNWSA